MVPTGEAIAEALASIPQDVPWPWACFRVLPMIRGARVPHLIEIDLDELGFEPASSFPSVVMAPGVEVSFGIEVDPVLVSIDQARLDAWDLDIEAVAPAALANLRRVVGTWQGSVYDDPGNDIAPARMLTGWPHWAVSLLLLPDELQRIFGDHDQLFIAPYQCNLVSLPVDIDRDIAADLIDVFGIVNPQSLLLGLPAFVLRGGKLVIEELPGLEHDPGDGEEGPGWHTGPVTSST
jgi:hypothetical protein